MAAALAMGRRGLGRVAPNPSVGAVVVKGGQIVGRGVTGAGGRPHGETIALAQAGTAARGATLYVTLEPCSHHGRTPPCCEAIVAAGISRLVYAIEDANPLVAGRGAAFCRDRGLETVAGIGAEAARRDHRGHMLRMTAKRPMVTLKLAETADGFVAGGAHDPRLAITGAAANGIVQVMRAMHDAIMVGIGTALADDPLMTVRLPGVAAKPLRIVLDARAQVRPTSRLALTARDAPALVLVGPNSSAEMLARTEALEGIEGLEIAEVPLDAGGRLDLAAALALLAERGLTRLFSEGGPTVAGRLIAENLADDVAVFTAVKPLGRLGVPTLSPEARALLADPARYHPPLTREAGADRLRVYERVA